MKASLLLLVATLLLFGILDGNCPRLCCGRDIPLNFHQDERMALEAVQRLKLGGSLWSKRYPPPKSNRERAQSVTSPKMRPRAPPPPEQLAPPRLPSPKSLGCITCAVRGGKGGIVP
ncbi:hypothetical protein COLO4_15451 [Corchorus olitorius]|uniref:Uncharacterized protein n=1 Tax=Corchorus olitorius TaxID=93759 RepID=A0A1R3JMQ1_9ROSI|nr:hypothetical protein COLO4_15451 [Corchorus olitorius]